MRSWWFTLALVIKPAIQRKIAGVPQVLNDWQAFPRCPLDGNTVAHGDPPIGREHTLRNRVRGVINLLGLFMMLVKVLPTQSSKPKQVSRCIRYMSTETVECKPGGSIMVGCPFRVLACQLVSEAHDRILLALGKLRVGSEQGQRTPGIGRFVEESFWIGDR